MYISQFGSCKKPRIPKFENYSISEHNAESSLCSCKPTLKIDSKFRFLEGSNASTSTPDIPRGERECSCDLLLQEPVRKISVKAILKQADDCSDGVSVVTVASSKSKNNCKKLSFAGDQKNVKRCPPPNPKDKNISVNVQVNLKKKRKKRCDCNRIGNETGTSTKQVRKCVCKREKVKKRKKSCECRVSKPIVIFNKPPEKRENFIMDAIKKFVSNNRDVNFFPYFHLNNRNGSQQQSGPEKTVQYTCTQKIDKKRCKCKHKQTSVVSKAPQLEDIREHSFESQKNKASINASVESRSGRSSAPMSENRNREHSNSNGKSNDTKVNASLKEIYTGGKASYDSQAIEAKK
ncbi:uncharacterized protein LOC132698326 [Cylas formicarius]|uniref:uncharacterized protein LOC132698326 n=1 Tax=Cylas formicarius TaxID=197179 RepID=UPI0029587B01|nr:uncharacterized protein LOC132698326 [Cylas formicarius]